MTAKMTPGPWFVGNDIRRETAAHVAIGCLSGGDICHVFHAGIGRDACEANATAIAALPDLIAACRRFADQIEWKPPWDDAGWKQCHEQARAALRKAGVE